MSRRLAFAVAPLVVAAALVLTGCTSEPRIPAAEPQPTAAPLFATDEEALAAATAAYEEYLAVLNAASSAPTEGIEDASDLVSSEHFLELQSTIDELVAQGVRAEGGTELTRTVLQQHSVDSGSLTTVVIYACLDVSRVRLLDLEGEDVTPTDRNETADLEVEFEAGTDEHLVVTRSDAWPAGTVCL